jgi:flagellar motor switch protein FliN
MSDIGLTQDQIDAILGGGGGGGGSSSLSSGDVAALADFERSTLASLPSVLNAMTGFEYVMGGVEYAATNPDELAALIGEDLIFSFPITVDQPMMHFLILDPVFAKQVAAALTGSEPDGDLSLNEMELSAISEVMSQANGSYLTNLSASLKTAASGESVTMIDAATAAGQISDTAMLAEIQLEAAGAAVTVRHLISGELAQRILRKLNEPSAAPPPPKPTAPAAQKQGAEQSGRQAAAMPVISTGNVMGSTTQFSPATFSQLHEPELDYNMRNLDMLMDVPLQVTVELGKTHIAIKQILEYGQGSLITLDKLAGEPIDLLVNGKYFAKGEVVVIDENFGVRITSILSPAERIAQLS